MKVTMKYGKGNPFKRLSHVIKATLFSQKMLE